MTSFLYSLIQADLNKVQQYLKVAMPFDAMFSDSDRHNFNARLLRDSREPTAQVLKEIIEKGRKHKVLRIQKEHADLLLKFFDTDEKVQIYVSMYRDTDWPNDATNLLSVEAIITSLLERKEQAIASLLSDAYEAYAAEELNLQKAKFKLAEIRARGRFALTTDWDDILKAFEARKSNTG